MYNITLKLGGISYQFANPKADVGNPRLKEMLDILVKEFEVVEQSFPDRTLDLYWDDACKDDLPIKIYTNSENAILPVEALAVIQKKKG
ncbi:MAG: hypothetical protein KF862_16405 [Chitinophagaceae bacterium]|jgi:hypothetical protein|nr:hypothetical protein [Chitinophagaceae bacterium]